MPTLTIRLTSVQAERLETEAEAFGLTKGSLVKSRIFDGVQPRRVPRPDQQELARIVAQLGKLGSNVNQLARAVNSGRAPAPATTERAIELARQSLDQIRAEVLAALGVKG